MADEIRSEADFIEANLEGIESDSICESEPVYGRNIAIYLESNKGKPSLILNGYKYRKVYNTKNGTRWNCSSNKNCGAFLYLNDKDEVIMLNDTHDHPENEKLEIVAEPTETPVVINSRKGKEMLLYRQYTYRKQYIRADKVRWVCSNTKNCKACVFTNLDNQILSSYEDHCHNPPKYYMNPDNILGALKEPIIIFETD